MIKVTRVTLLLFQDETNKSTLEVIVPEKVAGEFFKQIIGWKSDWSGTVEEVEQYLEAEKLFQSPQVSNASQPPKG